MRAGSIIKWAACVLLVASTAAAQAPAGPWQSIGPDGGSIHAIVPDPGYPNIVHVATDGGGVFRSTDNGGTWRAVAGVPAGVTRALVQAPSNRLVLYAGTERFGIFKSTDGGVSWAATATSPGVNVSNPSRPAAVDALAVDPRDARVAYASILTSGNILYKTTDGGGSWSAVGGISSTPTFRRVHGIRFDGTSPGTMYLFGAGSGVMKSVNAGQAWTHIEPAVPLPGASAAEAGFEPLDLQIDPQDSGNLYASFGIWGVYKSTDAGASWAAIHNGIPGGSGFVHGEFTMAGLAIDPHDSHTLYVAAFCRALVNCVEGAVFKSVDAGTTWTPAHVLRGGWNSAVVAVSRSTPATLFDGSQCGDVSIPPGPYGSPNLQCTGTLFRSTNGGNTWDDAFAGLESQAVVDVAADPANPSTLIAATRRGIYRSTDGGATWSFTQLAFSPARTLATAPGEPNMYAVVDEGGFDSVYENADHGQTWFFTTSNGLGDPDNLHRVFDLAVAPETPGSNSLYAGTYTGVFKSGDGGFNWTKLTGTFPSQLVAVKPGNPAVLFYTLNGSTEPNVLTLYRSTDRGATATPLSTPANITSLSFDPSTPDTMYAVGASSILFCSAVHQVYKSVDGGNTWTPASTGLPAPTPCGSGWGDVVVDPANPSRVFVGTHEGVFRTVDGGAHWTAVPGPGDGLKSLRIVGSRLLVTAPSSGGLFALDMDCAVTASPAASSLSAAGGQIAIAVTAPAGCPWSAAADSAFVATNASAGTGNGTALVTVAPNTGAPRSAAVTVGGATVVISQGATEMTVDRASLQFAATYNGAAFAAKTAAQAVRIAQIGPGVVSWVLTGMPSWLTVSRASGSGSGSVTFDVVRTPDMPLAATLQATVTVTFTGGPQPPLAIPVTLNLLRTGTSNAPIGIVDTPADHATGVVGSLPITGWALDDVEVTRVRILRDPVAPEPADRLVFIGDAAMIDGARPDVATAFSSTPRNMRGGWGYLLLTNMLPNRGDGNYKLYAVADDREGNSTLLGSRTITCTNSAATVPFGAIDTPGQGETVSGFVPNFGWVLAPGARRADPPGGGTVTVFVDGLPVGSPGAWNARSDLTTLFPQAEYNGVTTALGLFGLDTTTLANGVHTISWGVQDSQGGGAGIGSRFFTVANGTTALRTDFRLKAEATGATEAAEARGSDMWLPPSGGSFAPITGRRGFDLNTPYRTYRPDANGRVTVQSEELDRIELKVGARDGFMRPQLPLPAGSHLDAQTGTFTWMPGAGFVGAYDFVFLTDGGARDVRIVLNPKGSSRTGTQTIIDIPSERSHGPGPIVVNSEFFLAGWAADLDAADGSGVDAIHVWAYPVNEAGQRLAPVFVGTGIYGGARPDVGAVYGDQFVDCGYGLVVQGLSSGTYDVAVFAHSTVRGDFAPAAVVRVRVR